jgi:glycerophosphoryl diester phosphodiesterase
LIKPRKDQISQLLGPDIVNMGHRGTRGLAPENTLASFLFASQSTRFFELDTMLCGSGELVVIHDVRIDRTTNGTGLVSELSLSELQSFDAGSFFSPEFYHARIPTLREVLLGLPEDCVFDIEVKSFGFEADRLKLAQALVALIDELNVSNRIFISSFDALLLQKVKLENPKYLRGQLLDVTWEPKDWEYSSPDLILPNFKSISKPMIDGLKSKGFLVIPYTVNEEADWQKVLDFGVDGIITDRPDLLKVFLNYREQSQK